MSHRQSALHLPAQPGHAIRRLHQAAVALFMQEVAELGLTPVQYSSLQTICDRPGIDQKSLAQAVSFDTSTIGGVVDRLEARGLIQRQVSPEDRRVRLLEPTTEGQALLRSVVPRMLRAQERILSPLSASDAKAFMRLTQRLIDAHESAQPIPESTAEPSARPHHRR
jgi:MarR family transcriptional regulator, lower aerobic nicotinate degradation pathway regulator